MTTDRETTGGGELDTIAASLLQSPEAEQDEDADLIEAITDAPEAGDDTEVEVTGDEPEEDDDADEEAGDEAPRRSELITVKVDGEEQQVTLDDLKRSYSGQAYIQRGMQEVAQARKTVESEFHALRGERQTLAELIGQYRQTLDAGAPTPPDRELLYSDPLRYHRERAEYEEYQAEAYRLSQQQAELMRGEEAARRAEHQRIVEEGRAAIARVIPEFGDPQKAPALRDALLQTGAEYGFDQQEIATAIDPRLIIALNDLRQYRALKARMKAGVQEKTRTALPMTRPGAQRVEADVRQQKQVQARSRMKKTGSVDDVVRFLLT